MSDMSPNPYQTPATRDLSDSSVSSGLEMPQIYRELATVGLGLKVIYFGIIGLMLSLILGIPLGVVLATMDGPAWVDLLGLLLLLVPVAAILALNFGPFFCLAVPRGRGLTVFAWATASAILSFWFINISIGIGFLFESLVIQSLLSLTLLGGSLSFLMFLHRISRLIDRADLTRRCRIVFVLGTAFLVFLVLQSAALGLTTSSRGFISVLWIIPTSLCGLLLFVAYANVVGAIAKAIARPDLKRSSTVIL